jgi:hypothetical protein
VNDIQQLAILARLNRHVEILLTYEGRGDLTDRELGEVVLVANSANSIIRELQAGMDTEALIERLKGKT